MWQTASQKVVEYLNPRGVIIVEHNSGECPFSDNSGECPFSDNSGECPFSDSALEARNI
jgi:hypothetical protein